MTDKKKVFVIMPFQEEFFEMYEMIKMKFAEKYEFTNAGEEGNQQNIMRDIIEPIYRADVVIADLTGLNPNVMYELVVAHTFNKKTIVITKDDLSTLPFDLKQYRAKDYSAYFKKFEELIEYLKINLDGAVDGKVSYSNPVKDFMTLAGVENKSWFYEAPLKLEDNTDKGFLDFLADIEENTDNLSKDIEQMISEMETMTNGVSESTEAIERVNEGGGNGTASFVRKEAKKVAKFIDDFATKLRNHNQTIETLWDKVEMDTLGLLENQYAMHDSNKQSLVGYLISLKNMQSAIDEGNNSVEDLKESMNNNIGIERSLNQAIRFCVEDLSTYIYNTQRISSSIDKIMLKSKYIVGDIAAEEGLDVEE